MKENLLVRFSVVGFIALPIIGLVLAVVLSRAIRVDAIEDLTDEAVGAAMGHLLTEIDPEDLETPMTGVRYDEFHKFVQERIISDRTAQIKLWAKDGTVIYSGDRARVGERFPTKGNLLVALSGQVSTDVKIVDEDESEREQILGKLVEVYAPIFVDGFDEPQGVLEIYQNYLPISQRIDALQRRVLISIALGFLVLYGSLLSIVWSGWRTINRQRSALGAANSELQAFNNKLTATAEELERSRASLEREANEKEKLARIGRIISSSSDLNEVYEAFADAVRELMPCDRIVISSFDQHSGNFTVSYIWGDSLSERNIGDVFQLDNPDVRRVFEERIGFIYGSDEASEVPDSHVADSLDLPSAMGVPMVTNDRFVGILMLRSRRHQAYDDDDLVLADRIANQIAGAVANGHLYNQQKKAESAAREAENKFRTIVENATDGILVLRDRQILYANPAVKLMLGNGFDEGGQREFTSFIYEEDLEMVTRYNALRMRGKAAPEQYELRLNGSNGEIITVEIRPRVIDLDGEPAIVVLMRDITERNQLHKQLLQSQKMEAIGTLAGGIAHDFNNMLSAIIGFAQLLVGRLNGDETATQYLEEIQKASDRASILTNQLLTFSRHQVVKGRVINVNQVIRNLDGMFRRLIKADVELVHSLERDLWNVELDPNQMEQILVNLVINARDAMTEGGILRIETVNETLTDGQTRLASELQPGDYVTIAVSDSGIGMSENVKSRIFEPFFTTKEAGKGTGLGLSTTYGIVTQSDGIIEVDSQPGKGTEFKVYLPRTLAPTEGRVSDEEDENLPTGIESILIVDDESTVRGATASVLREQGYEVFEAANGVEALELANQQSKIELMLTDMVMPIMSGRMLAQHFNEQFPDVKLIFMSGYTDDILIQSEVSGGQVPFLQKPLMPDALARKVREVLDSH